MPDVKTTSTGAVKNAESGTTKTASEPENKRDGVITGDRAESPKAKSLEANTPTAKTLAEEERKAENAKSDEDLPKGFSEITGEVLQGDSFRLTLKRGNTTMLIPVPITGTNNVVVLDNTFRIIKAISEAKNPKELQDKFASFVQ